ncbi:MAG: transporter [Gammaproteobacteria bacterium]
MSFIRNGKTLLAWVLLVSTQHLYADAGHGAAGVNVNKDGLSPVMADSHAPIGVMGDHMHSKGEWMLSYRYMYMEMAGNRIGENSVTPETIATTVPNRFFGNPMQPPTLRVVPTSMDMHMHMLGAMYAPSDWLTLMVMAMYQEKTMDHITFAGGMGTTRLGTFTTKTEGIGDTRISGLIRLYDDATHHVHLNAGISLPTGSNDETDTVLTPMGMRPELRLPYPMQLGSGTFDLLPGITYTGQQDKLGWGAQYNATIRTGSDEGYSLGDRHEVTGWVSYRWQPWISNSVRLSYMHMDSIDGIDPNIVAPVQTADPDNHGGEVMTLYLGLNLAGQQGAVRGHRLALEAGIPLQSDLNGPQLETDLTLTAGWQYAF